MNRANTCSNITIKELLANGKKLARRSNLIMIDEKTPPEMEEIVDLEEYAKDEKAVPAAKKYRIRIDKEHFVVNVPQMTGKQLLELAGKNPYTNYAIYERLRGGNSRKIGNDETVSFRKPGIERFYTIPLDPQDGRENLRKDFMLSETDVQFLDSLGLKWEATIQNNINRVIIIDYPVPEGYNMQKIDINIRIEAGYPDQPIDMFYIYPHLSKKNNKSIGGLADDTFDGKNWQRWSRHRTGSNPWRPGIDDIGTHMSLVYEILTKELER